jgi:hypothetical protein
VKVVHHVPPKHSRRYVAYPRYEIAPKVSADETDPDINEGGYDQEPSRKKALQRKREILRDK